MIARWADILAITTMLAGGVLMLAAILLIQLLVGERRLGRRAAQPGPQPEGGRA